MSHPLILGLFDEYAAEILRRQDECWQSPSPEAFHQLRVYIKRTRALLGLVEQLSGSGTVKKRRKVFRDVFQAAGSVRDLHVQIDLVKSVEEKGELSVSWYREQLEQRERDAIQAFLCRHDVLLTSADVASVRQAIDKALRARNDVELTSEAWRHFDDRFANTIAFDVETKDLHDLRKRTKEASNLTWILERVFPAVALAPELKVLLDDLQNQLGKWHDFDVAVVWVEKVTPDAVAERDPEAWAHFVHALRRRRGALRAKVMRRWTKLCAL